MATLVVVWSCAAEARAQCEPIETAKVFPVDGGRVDGFGRAVAVDGDLAVLGAYNAGNSSGRESFFYDGPGAVYIYRATNNGWLNEAVLRGKHRSRSWLRPTLWATSTTVSAPRSRSTGTLF